MCIHSIEKWSMDINFKLQKVTFKAVRSIRINKISGKMQKYMKQWCLQQHTKNAKCNTAPAGTESERKTHLHIFQSTIYFSKWKVNAFFFSYAYKLWNVQFISFRFVVLHSFRFFFASRMQYANTEIVVIEIREASVSVIQFFAI